MSLRTKLTAVFSLTLLAASALPAAAAFPLGKKPKKDEDVRKLTPEQSALIDKAVVREAALVKDVKERVPLVETYIQNMRPDPVMFQVPDSDLHMLGRVDFGKVISDETFAKGEASDANNKKGKLSVITHALSYITGLNNALHLQYHEAGFVQMLLIDSKDFNRQTYTFSFLRRDFLGTIPTWVYDVTPSKKNSRGRFAGRIWVDRDTGDIVRFNGDFAGSVEDIAEYYHFDSWRTNVQEGIWLPAVVYCEESDPKSPTHTLRFKASNYIWGYSLKVPPKESEETSIEFDKQTENQAKDQATDLSPLQEQREWVQQAEDNVVERLFSAGLIDAPSPFDQTLADLANNILAYNNIAMPRPIKVRTLLTEPLESIAIGNTILVSKSLIDTTAIQSADGAQQLGNLNAILAFQVAHVILGHRIDTKYAFSDRLMFPTLMAFQRLPMHHTEQDDAEAAKKAMELLSVKELADSPGWFGLYLQQLQSRIKGLKSLTEPQIGDSLLKPDGTFWLQAMISKAPKLNDKDLKQQAAMPLGSFLKFDPWNDQVLQMHSTIDPLMTQRDKMPFEVTPVYLKLTVYQPPAPAATPAAAPAPAATPGATTPGDATQPAPTPGESAAPTNPSAGSVPAATPPATPPGTTPPPPQ
jgi:hypothetical protein